MSRPLTFVDPPNSKGLYAHLTYDYGIVFLGLYGQFELTWELLGFCDLKWSSRNQIYTSSFTRTFFYLKAYLDTKGWGAYLYTYDINKWPIMNGSLSGGTNNSEPVVAASMPSADNKS